MSFNFKLQHLVAVIVINILAFTAGFSTGFSTGESRGEIEGYKHASMEMHVLWSEVTRNGSRVIPDKAYKILDDHVVQISLIEEEEAFLNALEQR